MRYKNYVFDVGHVLLSYQWMDMLLDHGMSDEEANKFAKMMFSDPLWSEFDLENIPYDEVKELYVKKYPEEEANIRFFLDNKDLMSKARPGVYERILKLKEMGAKLYILSNYSSVLFEAHTRLIPIMDEFDGMVVSSQIHIIKPDRRIYEALFEKYNLNPAESIFYDDRQVNVDGSIAAGMDSVLITSEKMLEEELDREIENG